MKTTKPRTIMRQRNLDENEYPRTIMYQKKLDENEETKNNNVSKKFRRKRGNLEQ